MEKATSIAEMQKFHFGSKVFCADGEEAIVTHVGFNSASRRVTYIGVKTGRFWGKTVFVPLTILVDAAASGVHLSLTHDQLVASSTDVPAAAIIDQRSTVQNTATAAKGTVKVIAIHPKTGELAYLIVRNLRPTMDLLISEEFVTGVSADQITINVPEATLQTLPPYRSDEELQREIEDILFDLAPLHIDFPGMTTRVLDGVLYLDGNISSSLRGDMVQSQVMGVQGLLEVKNNLVGDDMLAADLAEALGRDERTRDLPIGVYPRLGNVRLSGAVHNAQQKAAATEIAENFPNVRSVNNDLVINAKTDLLGVMSAPAGGDSEDIIPGTYTRHTK
ncbi:BON domain-containing protein [Tengunoibacter tsumagoiensis]|uniref:BON domain-containing protein n=1 Tax=Tengunoibacter tsumagoiensis TaxID=2014871 RepID=A0A401ZYD8_9CHLR|nr:BON domain-containing protein [Tengunoibacter tsumagoiensis]GCE11874.1 hypothetical protein KTT_17330 [Tengunoibacter tsumagoiensis]